jgi:hypothetical protein
VVAASCAGWTLSAGHFRRDYDRRLYTDGAVSASSGFGAAPDAEDPARYGEITAVHGVVEEGSEVSMGIPLLGRSLLTGWIGWNGLRTSSTVGAGRFFPTGRWDAAVFAVEAGDSGRGDMDDLGVLLGFGLADVEDRIKPLPRPSTRLGGKVSVSVGGTATGSDVGFSMVRVESRVARTWGRRNRLSAALGFGGGDRFPEARWIATGKDLALTGQYAREVRGRFGAGATVSFSKPFHSTRRGVWQGSVFVDRARVWDGPARDKTGLGCSFFYRFWRFPLPLGMKLTRSLDDHDSQVSAAMGGRF